MREDLKALGDAIVASIKPALEKRDERIAALEGRLAALERQIGEVKSRGVFYRGVFQPSETYDEGDLVTHKGGLWHCHANTRERPGEGNAWQLCVKSGGAQNG